jgi:glutathione S-transferase
MKLYGSFTSPLVRHCRIALIETGLNCEFIETDQAGSAQQSPTKRVPFLEDGETFFTDSSSIIRYLREKAGDVFLPTTAELDKFCLVNTALDTTINLFFLSRDGVDIQAYDYTKRQSARIDSILTELDQQVLPSAAPYSDVELRLAVYLAWGIFRNRISIDAHANLQRFLTAMASYPPFKDTSPPV